MRTRACLVVLLAAALSLVLAGPASAKEKVTVAYLDEDSHRAVFYALEEGLVKSDLITVETRALNIPALIQATGTKQFDVIQTAVVAVPKAAERGLHLKILSVALMAKGQAAAIFVRADSPLRTAADLKGRTVAVESLGATVTTYMRIALAKRYGLNVDIKDGEVKFNEVPREAIPSLLHLKKLDAGYLYHTPAYKARRSGDFRVLQETVTEYQQATGTRPVTALMVTYPDKLKEKGAAIKEFNRLLKASADYARTRPEVYQAIAKRHNADPEFLRDWFASQYDFPATITDELAQGVTSIWQLTKDLGDLKVVPDVREHIWWEGVAK
jgi:NitT/TauT family transport system substrate-binding protein